MIKIQNIYYMLAYAFQVLNEDSYARIAVEEFDYIEDLLAAILVKGIGNQIKRGLGRGYISDTDSVSSPHGKIDVSASIKTRSLLKKKLVCHFDEYSKNTYINQVLKTTGLFLLNSANVEQKQKKAMKRILLYFHDVDILNPLAIQWSSIKYHRNNATYRMLINICFLVLEALLPTTQDGTKKLYQFKDEHLHRLFEKFVLEYYRKHCADYNASARHISWNVDDGVVEFLPAMKSDITLEFGSKVLIIDTKYYSRTLQTNTLLNTRTIHSSNMYQIFAYVKNRDIQHSGNVSGVLLYAKTDEEITLNNSYLIDGNRISVKTLDLDRDFSDIRAQLDTIIEEWLT